jgi:hypothetical protein
MRTPQWSHPPTWPIPTAPVGEVPLAPPVVIGYLGTRTFSRRVLN